VPQLVAVIENRSKTVPELLHKELTAQSSRYYEGTITRRGVPGAYLRKLLDGRARLRGYPSTRQAEYQILYKEQLAGVQRLDLFVVQEIVVENKVSEQLTPLNKHRDILISRR